MKRSTPISSSRVRIVAKGDLCTVRLENPADGTLFAQCPLDNERPEISVEPVTDSSRYFVLRVEDGSGKHAFLGMGFVERNDAFEFNVTLQDHVKRLKYEKEAEALAHFATVCSSWVWINRHTSGRGLQGWKPGN